MPRIIQVIAISLVVWMATATGSQPKTVFVVHSYHADQKEHVVEMTAGIEAALKGSGATIKYFHMDTKRRTDEAWKQKSGRLAFDMALALKPDVVIAMDDNAQKYFAMRYAETPAAAPIVFSGVNAEPSVYGFPRANVTGVLERPAIRESIDLLRKIVPGVKRIVLVSDKSPTTDSFHAYAKSLKLPVQIVGHEQPETYPEWKETIGRYEETADALGFYVCRTIKYDKGDDQRVPEQELMQWVLEHSRLPTVGFYDSTAESGVMCGISVSMREQGFAAGRIAGKILKGARPKDFKVAPTSEGRIQINLKTAARLGITIDYNIIKRAEVVIE